MCRFVFYRGTPIRLSALITEPAHSIIHQSYHSKEREEPLNGDGFGIAWYAPDESEQPAIFKDVSPAWSNQNLANLAKVVRSPCIVGHIRAATPGLPVSELNCHPFSWGRFSFAHNGVLGEFQKLRRAIQNRLSDDAFNMLRGSTDSEHLFALFANEYDESNHDSKLDAMAEALSSAIKIVETIKKDRNVGVPSLLNLVLTDGENTVITRYISDDRQEPHSLYLHTGSAYECIDGVCRMSNRSESGKTVLVASEPLSSDDGWTPVARNSMLLIDPNSNIEVRAMAVD